MRYDIISAQAAGQVLPLTIFKANLFLALRLPQRALLAFVAFGVAFLWVVQGFEVDRSILAVLVVPRFGDVQDTEFGSWDCLGHGVSGWKRLHKVNRFALTTNTFLQR